MRIKAATHALLIRTNNFFVLRKACTKRTITVHVVGLATILSSRPVGFTTFIPDYSLPYSRLVLCGAIIAINNLLS